jgi:serine/threonine-protein kinase RsbW
LIPNRLVLYNDLVELPRLARWVEAAMQRDVAPDAAFALALCLEEAVANIIMYGAASNERVEITVELERTVGAVTARIEDDGRRFNPTAARQTSPPTSLVDAKVGELGIHLVRRFASDMQYERRGERNCLMLRFRTTGTTAGSNG